MTSQPDRPDSRAREKEHPFLETAAEREDYIARQMSLGYWVPRTSRKCQRELAAAWGVEESTIRNYSTAAGRMMASALAEHAPAYAMRAMTRLEKLAKLLHDSTIPGDSGAAVRANEVILKASGFAEPEEDRGGDSSGPAILIQMTGAAEPGGQVPTPEPAHGA